MRHRFNGFLGHAISAGLFLAFSSHIAGAATISASASASCDVEGVVTTSHAPTFRLLLSGSGHVIGFPESTTGYRAGAGGFDTQRAQVRQGELLVSGADLVAVPEPATWFIPGLTLLAVAFYRRREDSPNPEPKRRPPLLSESSWRGPTRKARVFNLSASARHVHLLRTTVSPNHGEGASVP